MSKVTPLVTFVLGAAVGSAVSWYILKDKYEKLAQEEIDSVKEVYSRRGREERVENAINKIEISKTGEEEDPKLINEKLINDVADILNKNNYTNLEVQELIDEAEKPYVISPDEFGELYDYENISLTYYADKVLADDNDELVEDVDDVVGFESLSHFGEYEPDSVFVRNDRLKADYEILMDHRNYRDVRKARPRPAEVE